MFYKNKKIIILIVGIIIILVFGAIIFFVFKKVEKIRLEKGIIKTEQKKQEFYFLTKEEKEKAGIDPNLEIKAKKVKGDLGEITVIEVPKK